MKAIIRISLILAVIISASSCKKREPDTKIFDGNWVAVGPKCSQYTEPLQIRFVKVIGSKSNHRNQYEVIGGQSAFYCRTNDSNKYFFGNFDFKSSIEDLTSGVAIDRDLQFDVTKSDVLMITYIGGSKWEMSFKRVK